MNNNLTPPPSHRRSLVSRLQVLRIQEELSLFLTQKKASATHRLSQPQPPPPSTGSITSIRPVLAPTNQRPCKVVVVGDAGVGKTCLLQRLLTHSWPSPLPIPTVGMDFVRDPSLPSYMMGMWYDSCFMPRSGKGQRL